MNLPQPQKEHQWLTQLVGKWESTCDCAMGPDQPTMQFKGKETVESIGDFWTVGHGESDIPGQPDQVGKTVMTLGYDTKNGCYFGTFVCSMMDHLWLYTDGKLDDNGKVLTLKATGPMCMSDVMAQYEDSIEMINADHRVLRSRMLLPDGNWQQIMEAHYHRVG